MSWNLFLKIEKGKGMIKLLVLVFQHEWIPFAELVIEKEIDVYV